MSNRYLKKISKQTENKTKAFIAKYYRIRNFTRIFTYLGLYIAYVWLFVLESTGESIFLILLLALLSLLLKAWYLIAAEIYFSIMLRKKEEKLLEIE